ncbi:MAG: VanZ family protein [Deltaproteobacteria bacterium]|nr:VanZ family protein [Deltaproteobacteria bacterium]
MTKESSSPLPAQLPAASVPRPGWQDWLRYWGTVAAWMTVIAMLSSDAFSATNTNRYLDPLLRFLFPGISTSQILLAHTLVRKSAHFAEFLVLGLLVFWASRRGRPPRWRWRWMVQALVIAGGYALLDELRQAFVPSRTASFADSGVDSLGALVSQSLVYLRYRWLMRWS